MRTLPGFEPVLGLGALAVDAQFAFADDALDVGETQSRKPRLKKAVDAHAGFIGRDRDVLHAGRHWRRRAALDPPSSGAAARASEDGARAGAAPRPIVAAIPARPPRAGRPFAAASG